jgi:hypothetical protein
MVTGPAGTLSAVTTNPTYPLADFLDDVVGGYILGDLQSMDRYVPDDKDSGACGYPMVMAVLAGSELLGLLAGVGTNHKDRLVGYWQRHMKQVRPRYADLGEVAYGLMRNGLMHAYVTKPNIIVVRRRPDCHLVYEPPGVLFIDCITLADDFRASYLDHAKDEILNDPKGQARFDKFSARAWCDALKMLQATPQLASVMQMVPQGASTAASGIAGPGAGSAHPGSPSSRYIQQLGPPAPGTDTPIVETDPPS